MSQDHQNQLLSEYAKYLREDLNRAEDTVDNRVHHLRRFLEAIPGCASPKQLRKLKTRHIYDYVINAQS